MCESEKSDARDAVREARECCERIALVLDQTGIRAGQTGDLELVERLGAAKAAAGRAGQLIEKLAELLENEEFVPRQQPETS